MVNPREAFLDKGLGEYGVFSDIFPQRSARFGIQENGLVRKTYEQLGSSHAQEVLLTNQRHFEHLSAASEKLDRCISLCKAGVSLEEPSLVLRTVLEELGEITGDSEDDLTIPADLDEQTVHIMRDLAISAFCILECSSLALVDIYYTNRGDILLGEVNTMPELSDSAAYPKLMADLGMRYPYLLDKLIEQAIEHADRSF